MPESMVSADHYKALKLERDQLAARVKELEEAIGETLVPDNIPEYNSHGMGCGLEDNGISDRYEAMEYGWDSAIDTVIHDLLPHSDILTNKPAQSLLTHDAERLEHWAKALVSHPKGEVPVRRMLNEADKLRLQAEEEAR